MKDVIVRLLLFIPWIVTHYRDILQKKINHEKIDQLDRRILKPVTSFHRKKYSEIRDVLQPLARNIVQGSLALILILSLLHSEKSIIFALLILLIISLWVWTALNWFSRERFWLKILGWLLLFSLAPVALAFLALIFRIDMLLLPISAIAKAFPHWIETWVGIGSPFGQSLKVSVVLFVLFYLPALFIMSLSNLIIYFGWWILHRLSRIADRLLEDSIFRPIAAILALWAIFRKN